VSGDRDLIERMAANLRYGYGAAARSSARTPPAWHRAQSPHSPPPAGDSERAARHSGRKGHRPPASHAAAPAAAPSQSG
jgi:hypothetical protein